jgi:hypothetical protein
LGNFATPKTRQEIGRFSTQARAVAYVFALNARNAPDDEVNAKDLVHGLEDSGNCGCL